MNKELTLKVINILDKHEPQEYDVSGTQVKFKYGIDTITISKEGNGMLRIASENGQLILHPIASNCIYAKTERW